MILPKDKIVIIGDSWGCGEWTESGQLVHPGLKHFLSAYGCSVVNLSVAGTPNKYSISELKNFVKTENVDYAIWFQTDPIRDLRPYDQEPFPKNVTELIETGKKLLDDTYEKLNSIGIKIYCMGGLAKLENSINNYSNLVPIIPSIIEMLGGVQPEYWVGDWTNMRRHPNVRLSDELLSEIESKPKENLPREWFYPDGYHPNRNAHYKIFQYITNLHK